MSYTKKSQNITEETKHLSYRIKKSPKEHPTSTFLFIKNKFWCTFLYVHYSEKPSPVSGTSKTAISLNSN